MKQDVKVSVVPMLKARYTQNKHELRECGCYKSGWAPFSNYRLELIIGNSFDGIFIFIAGCFVSYCFLHERLMEILNRSIG